MNSRRPRSLADFFSAVRRRKLILLVPALAFAIAAVITLRGEPNLYESTARMRFASANTDGAPNVLAQIREFRNHLTSRENLALLVSKDAGGESFETMISQIRARISLQPYAGRGDQPGVFTVSYRATDPETACRATNEMADQLLTLTSSKASSALPAADVVRKRAADLATQLRDLERSDPWLIGVRSDLPATGPAPPAQSSYPSPEAIRSRQMTIDGLKDQQYKIHQQLADVERRITVQRQIVEQQKKGPSLRDNPTYAVLISKRTELQGQRDTLINRQELTEKHPRVLAISDQIAAINRQIEELRQQDNALVTQSAESRELAALESERNRLNIDLEVTGRELARRSADGLVQAARGEPSPVRRRPLVSKLSEQYLSLKRSYQEATSQLESFEAKPPRAEGAALGQLQILEHANLPLRPVLPNRPILISITALLGLAIGALCAFFLEWRRFKTLHDARDVEYYARLPLLAVIPRSATSGEHRRECWRATIWLALAATTSVAATLALSRIFIATDIIALVQK